MSLREMDGQRLGGRAHSRLASDIQVEMLQRASRDLTGRVVRMEVVPENMRTEMIP